MSGFLTYCRSWGGKLWRPAREAATPDSSVEDWTAASCEDDSEASHRSELSALGLPVRRMRVGLANCDVDGTGPCPPAGGRGCGIRQHRHQPPDDGPGHHGPSD